MAHAVTGDNLGVHIANRLVEVGCNHCFAVPGDFNLLLLDQLLKHERLECVWCCNELNAGYAADGYARKRGVACVVTTFCVGGMSAINAVMGAYAEDLPVIVISGGPNSNDFAANHILHHTIGENEYGQQLRAFKEVTCCQEVIQHIELAHRQIDHAISEALMKRKPAYIEVCCNLSDLVHPSFTVPPVPYNLAKKPSNPHSLAAAVEAAAAVLNSAVKPVMIAGVRIRNPHARTAFRKLADHSQYPVAILPDAKGMFSENYDRFIGTYWGAVSSPYCCEIVESSDIVLTAGAVWTDYTTVGYSLLLKHDKIIKVDDNRVTICNTKTFGCINQEDFLAALAEKIKPNDTGYVNYKRMYVPQLKPAAQPDGELLRTNVLFKHIEEMLDGNTALVVETGDSWFNGQKLKLPDGCEYEMQMRYGSIGWSVGALLGYATACAGDKRVIGLIGDGSFQMTVQEVSTMIRYNRNPIIFLINNGGYTIEVEIHDGPYNIIKGWDNTGIIQGFSNGEGKVYTQKVKTEKELLAAIEVVKAKVDHLCFVEVFTHRDDCSKELLEWGSRVASTNGRRPNPQ